jgi:hypothetical protein
MNSEKVNFIINTKGRDMNINPNPNTIDVNVPSGLLALQSDEEFIMTVNSFQCFKQFYSCQNGYNNQFQLIYTDTSNNSNVNNYYLQQGNYDVYTMTNYLNSILSNDVNITYDSIQNILNFTRISPIDSNHQILYLNIINCDAFLGFSKNIPILLPFNSTVSSLYPLNIQGDNTILIEISGDIVLNSSLDNLNSTQFLHSKIIFLKPIDVPANGLIEYSNIDGGNSFSFVLHNQEQINFFKLTCYNQDYQIFQNITDYIMTIQFEKKKKVNYYLLALEKILEYISDLFLLLSNQIFKI